MSYRTGAAVRMYYDPEEPATAILEPGVFEPFYMPLLWAVFFLLGGGYCLWRTRRDAIYGPQSFSPVLTTSLLPMMTAAFSLGIYAPLVVVSLDSSARDTGIRAFGERPLGVPNLVFTLVLQTVLHLSVPFVFWQLFHLVSRALRDGRRFGLVYLLTVGKRHPNLRWAQRAALGGIAYVFAIVLCWIVHCAKLGI